MKMLQVIGDLDAKFGATGSKGLAVAMPNVLRYPKMQNFGPQIFDFEQFFCVFLVLDHSKTLQSSKYAYGGLIPRAGIKN